MGMKWKVSETRVRTGDQNPPNVRCRYIVDHDHTYKTNRQNTKYYTAEGYIGLRRI